LYLSVGVASRKILADILTLKPVGLFINFSYDNCLFFKVVCLPRFIGGTRVKKIIISLDVNILHARFIIIDKCRHSVTTFSKSEKTSAN
jgi:hypothetical protein